MNSLLSRALELQHAAHELMYLGMDGEPIYSDTFCRLNKELLVKSDSLFSSQSSNIEEEANLCLALLMGYNATIYNDGDKESKIQSILDRSFAVLDHLPASLLKCQLLTYCYGEVFEEDLAQEAHQIMDSWKNRALSEEELEVMETLQTMEDNRYPCSEVED